VTTLLHEDRLDAVLAAVRACGAQTVLDLGCGDGDLFLRLAGDPAIRHLVGIELSSAALDALRGRLTRLGPVGAQVDLRQGSLLQADPALAGFDCAVMVEVIEHLDPAHLSQLERALFRVLRPRHVVMTTPNAEFNPLLGVPPTRFRHPDHQFEWTRAKFSAWAGRVAATAGYQVTCRDIAGCHPDLGGASQMAVFRKEQGSAHESPARR